MNKRILVITVALVLMLTLIIPVQLQAKSVTSPSSHPQQFTADGQIGIISGGSYGPARQFGPLMYQHQEGELVDGYIENSNWSDLNGAEISILHSADSIFNLKAGTFVATANGTITIKLADGGVLSGNYQAFIYGKFVVDGDGSFYYTVVNDIAKWDLGDLAQGNAFATLYLGTFDSPTYGPIQTYTGNLSMSGTHK